MSDIRQIHGSKLKHRASFSSGFQDGLPIGLGYLTISTAFGLYVVSGGLPPLFAIFVSLTNLTSSGQFAGVSVILAKGGYLELAFTVLLVNLRYVLMSLSLSQRLAPQLGTSQRLVMSFGVTDEIFAVAIRKAEVGFHYFLGLMVLPICGWSGGTVFGALLGALLPKSIQGAFGILLYAMFVAIIIPPAKSQKVLRLIIVVAAGASALFYLLPFFRPLSAGWKIIFSTLIAAGLGASLFPVSDVEALRAAEEGGSDEWT